MVRLVTVSSGFEAKVIAARLGAEGVLWELRGGVDGVYPMGPSHVYVPADDLEVARSILLHAEVESAFDGGDQPDEGDLRAPMSLKLVVLAMVGVAALSLVRGVLGAADAYQPPPTTAPSLVAQPG